MFKESDCHDLHCTLILCLFLDLSSRTSCSLMVIGNLAPLVGSIGRLLIAVAIALEHQAFDSRWRFDYSVVGQWWRWRRTLQLTGELDED